jgi:hypothetical protein
MQRESASGIFLEVGTSTKFEPWTFNWDAITEVRYGICKEAELL